MEPYLINALDEFERLLEQFSPEDIEAMEVSFLVMWKTDRALFDGLEFATSAGQPHEHFLYPNYTNKEFEEMKEFLSRINYSCSYGTQYLYGHIWLKDGTWLARREYDGSEWWSHNKAPEMPVRFSPIT